MRKLILALFMAVSAVTAANAQETVTIAAFGDSLTQGYGLVADKGFVPQLGRWLEDQGAKVQLINAGVSGDTTAGGAARIAWTLTPEVDAVIVALGGNDLLRGLPPEEARANLTRIVETAQSAGVRVLLVGMEAPGNYGADYKAAFDAIYPDLAAKYGTLLVESFFVGLREKGDDPAAMRPFLQSDGIHPNAEGVTHIVEGLGPYVLRLIDRARES